MLFLASKIVLLTGQLLNLSRLALIDQLFAAEIIPHTIERFYFDVLSRFQFEGRVLKLGSRKAF